MKKKWSKMEISCQFPGWKSAGICLHDTSTLRLWIVLLFLIALLYEGGGLQQMVSHIKVGTRN